MTSLRCDYRIPLGDDGAPRPTAADIVLLFPYPTEESAVKGAAKPLTDRWGFTTLSLSFPPVPGDADRGRADRDRYFVPPESGSGKAWIDAIDQLRRRTGLPARPVFAMGRSAGASAAGLFAEANPQLVAAVGMEAARIFPERPTYPGPTLLIYGAHDYVQPVALPHLQRVAAAGLPWISFTYPPSDWKERGNNPMWHHPMDRASAEAMWRWLADVADMRLDHAGKIPAPSAWPCRDGGGVYTSEQFRDLVRKVRPAAHEWVAQDTQVAVARPASAVKPKGLVILAAAAPTEEYAECILDAECLSDQGWTVLLAFSKQHALAPAIRSVLADPAHGDLASLPWLLAADDPQSLRPLLDLRPATPAGVIVSLARRPVLAELAALRLPLAVIDTDLRLAALRSEGLPATTTWRPIRPRDQAAWHRERCRELVALAETWIKAK